MNIEHKGGSYGLDHIEIWGKKNELITLESDDVKMQELLNDGSTVIYFALDEAEMYYLDKETKLFTSIQ